MAWLINASQLDRFRKNQKNVVILDVSWHLPSENRNPQEEFLQKHISGARFLNLETLNDKETTLPNMLMRDAEAINKIVGSLGISNDHKIIFYDNSPLHTSCRAYWMFKVFGHNTHQMYVLDGGLAAWEKYGGKLEAGEPKNIAAKTYHVNFQAQNVRTLVQMKTNLHHPSEQVIDMRHPVRYAGGKEPRKNTRTGHIPGSYSFPYFTMFEEDGCFKPLEKIQKQLSGLGVDLSVPIITYCGSGTTATILNFTLDLMNQTQNSLYDGSWSEWGAEELYPGEEHLAERPVEISLEK